jgi:hypothetical protein
MAATTSHATASTSISYTTFSTSLPSSKFSTPTLVPSIFSWGPALSCASASPSNFPLQRPTDRGAACAISNARAVNDHAFWDLYACCKGTNLTAIGDACTGVCRVGQGQTAKEVGECLAKRVEVVVCKLGEGEAASAWSSSVASSTGGSIGSATRAASASAAASQSASAGNAVGVVNVAHSKAGAVVFGMLAMGAFSGMIL